MSQAEIQTRSAAAIVPPPAPGREPVPVAELLPAPIASVLICTYNRARLLAETLDSLAAMVPPPFSWNVIVVDNNSTDRTADVVRARRASFPVELTFLREARQGKSYALNTGLSHTQAPFVAFTDDDVRVAPNWLDAAITPLLRDERIGYTGGRVRPLWGAPRPEWLAADRGDIWGAIATVDYGNEPFDFEDRGRIPVGANMAVRRALIDRVGGFHPALDRTGASLVGQGQAEFFYRTRIDGSRGLYVPGMVVDHHVPPARLTRAYFRRWWFGKGISRARLDRIHPRTDLGVDMRRVPRIAGVPRFIFSDALRHAVAMIGNLVRRDPVGTARHEMMLMYSCGYAWEQIWRRRRPAATWRAQAALPPASPAAQESAALRSAPESARP